MESIPSEEQIVNKSSLQNLNKSAQHLDQAKNCNGQTQQTDKQILLKNAKSAHKFKPHLKNQSQNTIRLKSLKNNKIQVDLLRVKNIIKLQKQIGATNNKFDQIEKNLEQVQRKISDTKKTLIRNHINQIEQNRHEREIFDKQTNSMLVQINKKKSMKDKNISSIMEKYNKEYSDRYQLALRERKNNFKSMNLDQLKQHAKQYDLQKQQKLKKYQLLNKKHYRKAKSQMKGISSLQDYSNEFSRLNLDHSSIVNERIRNEIQQMKDKERKKRQSVLKMIQKRIDYGNRVKKQKINARVKTEAIQSRLQKQYRIRQQQRYEQRQKILNNKKPHLDTNIKVKNLFQSSKMQLNNLLNRPGMSSMEKLLKLKAMQDRYEQKVKNKNPQAIQMLTEFGLAKAKLFLNDQ